jgi:hypothetical protein
MEAHDTALDEARAVSAWASVSGRSRPGMPMVAVFVRAMMNPEVDHGIMA